MVGRDFKRSPSLSTKGKSTIAVRVQRYLCPAWLWRPLMPNSNASLGNLLFSLEKATSTPNLNFCNLRPLLLIVLVMDRENAPTCWEAAPLNLPFWRWPLTRQLIQPFLLRSHKLWLKDWAGSLSSWGHPIGLGSAGRAQRSSRRLSNAK